MNIDTSGDINPKLDALAEIFRYFYSLHGKMLTLELDSGCSNTTFVPAVPLSPGVTHILVASDAAFYRTIQRLLAGGLGRLVLQLMLQPYNNTEILLRS